MRDPERRHWLFDPTRSGVVVRSHRPSSGGAATQVVSDVLWAEVVTLLRWAEATGTCRPELVSGSAWRTAAASAGLLARLPGLCAELGQEYALEAPPESDGPATVRLQQAADRLAARLRTTAGVETLPALAGEVDAVGAAAVAVLAERADWTALR
ncbi:MULTISPECIES: hypothetical protein [unclassified Modestobacter]